MKQMSEQEKNRRWKRSVVLFFAVLGVCLLAAVSLAMLADARHVRFYMMDAAEITTAYGKPYEDPGCTALRVGRISGEGDEELEAPRSFLFLNCPNYGLVTEATQYTITRVFLK